MRNRVAISFEVQVERVFDLTAPGAAEQLGIEAEALMGEGYEVTQSLASRLRREGIQAIITNSARDYPNGRNIILFLENIDPPNIVERARDPV